MASFASDQSKWQDVRGAEAELTTVGKPTWGLTAPPHTVVAF